MNPTHHAAAPYPCSKILSGLAALLVIELVAAPTVALAKATPLIMTRPFEPTPTVRAVEAPPLRYAQGPTLSGRTYSIELPDARQVDYLCTLALGPVWPKGGYWMGCYDGRMDAVIVPAKGAWPSERERQALIAHEWAHARGWKHEADGRFGRHPAGEAHAD